jgi:hypothetical protein
MNRTDPVEDRLSTWLQEEAAGELPDWVLGATFERTRIEPQGRRAGRWRLVRPFTRTTGAGPSPGRKLGMLNLTRATAVVALIALGAGVTFTLLPATNRGIGGDPAPASPPASPLSSPSSSPMPWEASYVHGKFTCCDSFTGGVLTEVDGQRQKERGATGAGTSTFDDPRLSGALTLTQNVDEFPQPTGTRRAELAWNSYRIENTDGAWVGTGVGAYDYGQTPEVSQGYYSFTGEGAYAGLSAILFEYRINATYPDIPLNGLIFPGALPPGR